MKVSFEQIVEKWQKIKHHYGYRKSDIDIGNVVLSKHGKEKNTQTGRKSQLKTFLIGKERVCIFCFNEIFPCFID